MTTSHHVFDHYVNETQKNSRIELDENTMTVRIHRSRALTHLELPAAAGFLPGGVVLLPVDRHGGAIDGRLVCGAVLEHLSASPGRQLLVAAHCTDTSDPELTEDRARMAWAALIGDVEGWVYAGRTATPEEQRAVAAWARGEGADLGDSLGPDDWRTVHRLFDASLARLLKTDAAGLATLRRRVVPVGDEAPPPPEPEPEPDPQPEPVPDLDSKATLRYGANGEDVRELQEMLTAAGYPLEADGMFGPATQQAVRAFQTDRGLTVDGIVGPQSWGSLYSAQPVDEPAVDESPAPVGLPLEPAAEGCGDAWPIERVRIEDFLGANDDRVDFLTFEPSDAPKLLCHDGDCNWKKCDVYRKRKYRALPLALKDDETPAPKPDELVPAPPVDQPDPDKSLHGLELAAGQAFRLEGSVLLPVVDPLPGEEPTQAPVDVLAALAAVCQRAGEGPNRSLAAGHGGDLAGARAESVRAFFAGRDPWSKHSKEHADVGDWQQVLAWAARAKGWDCDPGAVDNVWGTNSKKALQAFRNAYWAETKKQWLHEADVATTGDWQAFHDVLGEALAAAAGAESFEALANRLSWLEPAALAASPAQAPRDVEIVDYPGVATERVDLLLFEEADAPAGAALVGGLEAVYRAHGYRARWIVPGGAAHVLSAVVQNEAGEPQLGLDYEVRTLGGDRVVREGKTSEAGAICEPLPPASYTVFVRGDEDDAPAPVNQAVGPEPWEGGTGTLEELLAGDYQRRGSYRENLSGFKNPALQAFLVQACAEAGVDPRALTEADEDDGQLDGDAELTVGAGQPKWLKALLTRAATSTEWDIPEQICSRLLGAYYYAFFVEKILGPKGIPMPANVEYSLLHLGKSTPHATTPGIQYTPGNNAATFEAVGGWVRGDPEPFAYCMSSASRVFKMGLELFGFQTAAKGFAQDMGCPVPFFVGSKTGDEHVPRPGDVMSVRTHLSPASGHVITIVHADGDGTSAGNVWHVSGNSAHRSVAVGFNTWVTKAQCNHEGKPPKGTMLAINLSRNSVQQPHLLAEMSDAQLEDGRVKRLEGEHRLPNEAGRVAETEPKPEGAALVGLLASGDVPTRPIEPTPPATVLKAELKVARFRARLASHAGDPWVDRVALEPNEPLALEWVVHKAERLVLQPGDVDLTHFQHAGTPTTTIDLREHPPGPLGIYTLEAHAGGQVSSAEIMVEGVYDLQVRLPDVEADPKKPRQLSARVMKGLYVHPRYGSDRYEDCDVIHGMAGSMHAWSTGDEEDYKFWYWGQVTPKSDLVVTWKGVSADPGARAMLTLNRVVNTHRASDPVEVTDECAQGEGHFAGTHDYVSDKKYRTFWEVEVDLQSGVSVAKPALIRLREDYELPGIAEYSLVVAQGDETFTLLPGAKTLRGVMRGATVTAHWRLTGQHSKNALGIEINGLATLDAQLVTPVHWEKIRPWTEYGKAPPEHEQDEGSHTFTIPEGDGSSLAEVKAKLKLFNPNSGDAGAKTIKFKLVGDGAVAPVEYRIRLLDKQRELMRSVPYRVRGGGKTIAEGTSEAQGWIVLEAGQRYPETVTVEWGAKTADGYEHSSQVELDLDRLDPTTAAYRRLEHLGFPAYLGKKEQVKRFQKKYGLSVTGTLDPTTQAEIRRVHEEH